MKMLNGIFNQLNRKRLNVLNMIMELIQDIVQDIENDNKSFDEIWKHEIKDFKKEYCQIKEKFQYLTI